MGSATLMTSKSRKLTQGWVSSQTKHRPNLWLEAMLASVTLESKSPKFKTLNTQEHTPMSKLISAHSPSLSQQMSLRQTLAASLNQLWRL